MSSGGPEHEKTGREAASASPLVSLFGALRLFLVCCGLASAAQALPVLLPGELGEPPSGADGRAIVLDDCPATACIELPAAQDADERHSSRQPIRPDDVVLNSDVYVVWNGADGIIALIWDGGRGPTRVIWDDTMKFTEESADLTSRWIVDFSGRRPLDPNDPNDAFGVSAENVIRPRARPRESSDRPMRLLVAGAGQFINRDGDGPPPQSQQKVFGDTPPELVWQPEQSGLVALFTRVTRSKRTVAVLTLILLWVMVRLAR